MQCKKIFLLTLVGAAGLWLCWQCLLYRHYLSFVPEGMKAWHILYAEEEAWGVGPGGNETGFILYALPDDTAEIVQASGIKYLTGLSHAESGGWNKKYGGWKETPLMFNETGHDAENEDNRPKSDITNYLYRYGFYIPLKPAIKEGVNEALSKSGSFYAYGGSGLLIIIPQKKWVVYAYSG